MTSVLVSTSPKSSTHLANVLLPEFGLQRHFCEQRAQHGLDLDRPNIYDFVVSLAHHLSRDPPPGMPTDSRHIIQHWICTSPAGGRRASAGNRQSESARHARTER